MTHPENHRAVHGAKWCLKWGNAGRRRKNYHRRCRRAYESVTRQQGRRLCQGVNHD